MFADILAGAIAGGSCSHTDRDQIANGWFAIFIDPEAFAGREFYDQQLANLRSWIKSCPTAKGVDEVLLPGEPETRTAAQRCKAGIPIEPNTWDQLRAVASSLDVPEPETLS